jgi:hypothetical protein
MASIKVGAAEIDLTLMTGKFTSGIKKAEKGFAQLRKDINTTNGQLRAIAGAAGFGYAAAELFEFGAAVEETGSKFRTVFGEDSQQVQTELAGVRPSRCRSLRPRRAGSCRVLGSRKVNLRL